MSEPRKPPYIKPPHISRLNDIMQTPNDAPDDIHSLPPLLIRQLPKGKSKSPKPIEIINDYLAKNSGVLLDIKKLLDNPRDVDFKSLSNIQKELLTLIHGLDEKLAEVEKSYIKSKSFVYPPKERETFELFLNEISRTINTFKQIEEKKHKASKLHLDLYHANVFLNFIAKGLLRINDKLQSPSTHQKNADNSYSFLLDQLLMLHKKVSSPLSSSELEKIKNKLAAVKEDMDKIKNRRNCEILFSIAKYISNQLSEKGIQLPEIKGKRKSMAHGISDQLSKKPIQLPEIKGKPNRQK